MKKSRQEGIAKGLIVVQLLAARNSNDPSCSQFVYISKGDFHMKVFLDIMT